MTIEKSESINELQKKKLLIQNTIETASKDTANPDYESKYADLCEVVYTIKKALETTGAHLLIEQYPQVRYDEDKPIVSVETIVTDVESGEFEKISIESKPAKDTPQAIGSVITYLRRYVIMPVFGVVPDDDDGNNASEKGNRQQGKNNPQNGVPPQALGKAPPPQDTKTSLPLTHMVNLDTAINDAGIDPDTWSKYIDLVWRVKNTSELTMPKYTAIMKILKTKPETITATVEAQK